MKIMDCFTFFNEIEFLRIRLECLKDQVDYFVLCESKITFSGKPKPLYFEENKHLFDDFKDRIIHVVVEDTPQTNISWDRERWQRNAIIRGLQGKCDNSDIVCSGDVDELPNLNNLFDYYQDGNVYHPMMDMFYYYLNAFREGQWFGTKICSFEIANKLGIDPLRNVRYGYAVNNRSFHFSYLGGAEAVLAKMDAFSDIELNNPYIREHVVENIKNNKDLFFRGQTMKIVPIDETYPKYIRDNQDKYKHLIKEI